MDTITQIRVADMSFDDTVCQSTGSRLLDSLNHCDSLGETSILFGEESAYGLGLHHMEIPTIGSKVTASAQVDVIASKKHAEDTARQQAVSRLSSVLKQDRKSVRS